MKKFNLIETQNRDKIELNEQDRVNAYNGGMIKHYVVSTFILIGITTVFLFIAYGWDRQDKAVIVLSICSMIGLFVGFLGLMLLKNTVGIKLAIQLMRMRKLRYKGFVLLKIFDVSGRPQYLIVKASPRITYKYKENGEFVNKVVFYDTYGKYEDFLGIPIIECNPNDIQLKNTFNGSRIGTAPEIIEKNITDNSMSASQIDSLKSQRKWILIALGIILGLALLGFDLYSQRLAESNTATINCYKEFGKTAVIQGSILFLGYFKKEEE